HDSARNCRPHGFAYAEGKPCGFWFCPYCNALAAAEAFERLRRARREHGREYGFLACEVTLVVPGDSAWTTAATLLSPHPSDLPLDPDIRVYPDSALSSLRAQHALARLDVLPFETNRNRPYR